MLSDLGISTFLCVIGFWTLDEHTSSTLILNTGVPQGCIRSPLLFSIFTENCLHKHGSDSVIMFKDNTSSMSLIRNMEEIHYLRRNWPPTPRRPKSSLWLQEVNINLSEAEHCMYTCMYVSTSLSTSARASAPPCRDWKRSTSVCGTAAVLSLKSVQNIQLKWREKFTMRDVSHYNTDSSGRQYRRLDCFFSHFFLTSHFSKIFIFIIHALLCKWSWWLIQYANESMTSSGAV